jgi:hypothetical protein
MKFTVFLAAATWTFLMGLLASEVHAQVNITYPTNRTVLQRDKNNSATVHIRGTYTVPVERIEVQLRAINGGATSGWTTIQNNPQGGYYAGQIDWTGGWYEMEVRGWRGDQMVGSSTLPRLGIGEVFLVAGQSNAQGYFNYGGPGAGDDRVNCVNFYNDNSSISIRTHTSRRAVNQAGRGGGLAISSPGAWVFLFFSIMWDGTVQLSKTGEKALTVRPSRYTTARHSLLVACPTPICASPCSTM